MREGRIIAIENNGTLVLYPRGANFLTSLSGNVTVDKGGMLVKTSVDLRGEIRRGDLFRIDSHVCRVSTRPKDGHMRADELRVSALCQPLHSALCPVCPVCCTAAIL